MMIFFLECYWWWWWLPRVVTFLIVTTRTHTHTKSTKKSSILVSSKLFYFECLLNWLKWFDFFSEFHESQTESVRVCVYEANYNDVAFNTHIHTNQKKNPNLKHIGKDHYSRVPNFSFFLSFCEKKIIICNCQKPVCDWLITLIDTMIGECFRNEKKTTLFKKVSESDRMKNWINILVKSTYETKVIFSRFSVDWFRHKKTMHD